MNKFALILCSAAMAAFPNFASAADVSEPTEVGTTTMPPGEYSMVHKGSKKAYTLMVTSKGMMIMSGSSAPAAAAPPVAAPVAAAPVTTAAPALTAPAVPAAPTAATAVPAKPGVGSLLGNDMVKSLVNKGMKEGMGQLKKVGGTKALNGLIK